MAFNIVSVCPTGAVSRGVYRLSFRSGPSSMAPLHGGALTTQAGIGLTCRDLVAGRRMVVMACRGAAGLHGGDLPLDPKKVTLSEQLKSVAERTLSMLHHLPTPIEIHPVGVRRSVALELGELRADGERLLDMLTAGTISDHAASITLLGLHARVEILLKLFSGNHESLEESTKNDLLNVVGMTEFCLAEEGVRRPAGEEVARVAETSVPNLLKTLARKTIILLAAVTEFHLSKDVTLPGWILVAPELNRLRDRCDQLIMEVTEGDIADHVAVGTLLGLHARFRIVFLFYVRVANHSSPPDSLEASISAGLATSMTDTEERVKPYLQKKGE